MNLEKPQKISILGIFNGQFPKNIRRPLEKRTENFLKHGEFKKILGVFSGKTRREFSCGVKHPLAWRLLRNGGISATKEGICGIMVITKE